MPKIINAEEFAVIKSIEIEKEKGEINAILTFSFNDVKPQFSKVCEDTITRFELVRVSKDEADVQYKINGGKKIGKVIANIEVEAKKNKLVSAKDHDFFVTVYSNLLEFSDFPQEILLHIFQFISDRKDLAAMARVNTVWKKLSEHNTLWQSHLQGGFLSPRPPGELKVIDEFFNTSSLTTLLKTIAFTESKLVLDNELKNDLAPYEIGRIVDLVPEEGDLKNLRGIILADFKNEITNNQDLWKNRENFAVNYTSYTYFLGDFNTFKNCLSVNPNLYYVILPSTENENIIDKLYQNFSECFSNRWLAVIHKDNTQPLKQWAVAICAKKPVMQEQISETNAP